MGQNKLGTPSDLLYFRFGKTSVNSSAFSLMCFLLINA